MAHFAQLDDTNKVIQVIVINNSELLNNNIEEESKGIEFCRSLYGENTNWVQTSYNNNFRKHFASIDYTYDPINDYFIPPQPYTSWILNNETITWEAPFPAPTDGKAYSWNENNLEWVEFIAGE